ncbi:MAG: gamma-glutamyltransferase [Burkholderiales bacterium]
MTARSAGTKCPRMERSAGDTVFVAAVDAEGNAASLIQSLYFYFGSGVAMSTAGHGRRRSPQ